MCLTLLHCRGRTNRLGLPGFATHCPCSFFVPLQPWDTSLQVSALPAGPGSPLTWSPAANMDPPSRTPYLAPCPVLHLLQHWQLYTAEAQCWWAQAQVAALCYGSSPLTCAGQSNSRERCYFMALSSPVLSLAQQTCTLLEGSQPTEMGKRKFLWVKFSLKATELCLCKTLLLLW